MIDKEMTNLFLFGGRCLYHGQYVNVVGKNEILDTYTVQAQNGTHTIPDVRAADCEPAPEVNG